MSGASGIHCGWEGSGLPARLALHNGEAGFQARGGNHIPQGGTENPCRAPSLPRAGGDLAYLSLCRWTLREDRDSPPTSARMWLDHAALPTAWSPGPGRHVGHSWGFTEGHSGQVMVSGILKASSQQEEPTHHKGRLALLASSHGSALGMAPALLDSPGTASPCTSKGLLRAICQEQKLRPRRAHMQTSGPPTARCSSCDQVLTTFSMHQSHSARSHLLSPRPCPPGPQEHPKPHVPTHRGWTGSPQQPECPCAPCNKAPA